MGKGGGGSQPQVSTAYQTNLPEYAKPYVTNMLDATQRQLFNTSGGDITGFKPYVHIQATQLNTLRALLHCNKVHITKRVRCKLLGNSTLLLV